MTIASTIRVISRRANHTESGIRLLDTGQADKLKAPEHESSEQRDLRVLEAAYGSDVSFGGSDGLPVVSTVRMTPEEFEQFSKFSAADRKRIVQWHLSRVAAHAKSVESESKVQESA